MLTDPGATNMPLSLNFDFKLWILFRVLAIENGEKALLDMIEDIRNMDDDDPGPFDAKSILKVVEAVASALNYLHTEQHLLHGDIKSGNVLIKGDFEQIKLCDFGVTMDLDENLIAADKTQEFVGTGPFTPKEAFLEDGVISSKADIFALGCVIFEMLALEAPHVNLLPFDNSGDRTLPHQTFPHQTFPHLTFPHQGLFPT